MLEFSFGITNDETNALHFCIILSIKMLSHKAKKFKTCVWYRRKKLKRDRPDNLSNTRHLTPT